jgi:hypothetical protein
MSHGMTLLMHMGNDSCTGLSDNTELFCAVLSQMQSHTEVLCTDRNPPDPTHVEGTGKRHYGGVVPSTVVPRCARHGKASTPPLCPPWRPEKEAPRRG